MSAKSSNVDAAELKRRREQSKRDKRAKRAESKDARKAFTGPKDPRLRSAVVNSSAREAAPRVGPAGRQFFRTFSHRDAAKLAWMACVANPKFAPPMPIPASITPGASPATPRMFRVGLKGVSTANALGRFCIGANADAWIPNPNRASGAVATPYYCYLGNSSAFGGARGYPVHYTIQTWAGNGAGSDGTSWPAPNKVATVATTGLYYVQLPDKFIAGQPNADPSTGNNSGAYSNVALELRARPIAPPAGGLVMAGTMWSVQQTMGDSFATCPSAANATGTVGGIDAVAYIGGMTTVSNASGQPLSSDMVALTEWDLASWPRESSSSSPTAPPSHSWMSIVALPNQSCSFGQWAGGNTGATQVGYPQCAFMGFGAISGQQVEFEVDYVYAYYGVLSYEVKDDVRPVRVPDADVKSLMTSGLQHLQGANRGIRGAVAAVAQEAVDKGEVGASSVGSWIQAGSSAVEKLTGQSIGELVGEGLGFVAEMLL